MNYLCQRRPPVPITLLDPVDEEFLRNSIKELTTIMSNEWVEESELSSEEIQIHTPSSTIQCRISRTMVDVLYNPTVGANLMSKSFASTYLGDKPFAPTNRSLRIAPRTNLKGLGLLHNITTHHDKVKMVLDFHIFDMEDFDIMKGPPRKTFR